MTGHSDVAELAALIGQPARANMLLVLLDGRGRTATELADIAGVTRATASSHLSRLVDGEVVRVDRQGRHRYFRLANPEVAGAIESLVGIAGPQARTDQRYGPQSKAMRRARMCYDHVAGSLGIGIVDRLVEAGALVEAGDNFELTRDGERFLEDFRVDVEAARRRRRYFARTCLDWSERRPHLAGALGAAIADRLFELQWIRREPGCRTLAITPAGRQGLPEMFGSQMERAVADPA